MVSADRTGARRQLAEMLVELHEAAGSPPLDSVAARAMARRPRDATWRVTGKRISDWKLGSSVPASVGALTAVVRRLIELARAKGMPGQTGLVLYDEEQWRRWWDAAKAESPGAASVSPVPQGRDGRPIREFNPSDLEVHAAIDSGAAAAGLDSLPTYIRREHDDWLTRIVSVAVGGQSQLAVLVGNSSTGKTRACWEAIQAMPPDWLLWHPIQPGRPQAAVKALRSVGPRTVIWLNELNHYLLTPGSSLGEHVAGVLRELLRSDRCKPVLILGTIWPEYWAVLTSPPDVTNENDPHSNARSLLTGFSKSVPEIFDPDAFFAGRVAVDADPRLAEAFHNADRGRITQYLAGVPVLVERYQNAPAPARALIEVAMDARRLGHGIALPQDLLEAGASFYLSDEQWDSLGENWLEEALSYTGAHCRGIRGPLTRMRPRPNMPTSNKVFYRLADYLIQLRRTSQKEPGLPGGLWDIYARYASKEDLGKLATEAGRQGDLAAAARLWAAAADTGDESAFRQAARALHGAGHIEDALAWYERAAHAGHDDAIEDAARMLDDADRTNEALIWYKRAAGLGDTFSVRRAAQIMVEIGQADESLAWLGSLAKAGDITAMRNRAWLLRKNGRINEAIAQYEKALEAGNADSMIEIARILDRAGRTDESLSWYIRAADAGDTFALRQAARMLQEVGRLAEALNVLDRAAESGDPYALREGAQFLCNAGRIDDALSWYVRAADTGDTFAFRRAARMMQEAHRADDAIVWFGKAADMGDVGALQEAISEFRKVGRANEIITWLEARADSGDNEAVEEVILTLQQEGGAELVLHWLEGRAQVGSRAAMSKAISVLEEVGRIDDAIVWSRHLADSGDLRVVQRAAEMLRDAGRIDEAVAWYQRAADSGDLNGLEGAVQALHNSGRTEEAIAWLQARADSGDQLAPEKLAYFLEELGRVDAALSWYERAAATGSAQAGSRAVRMLINAGRRKDIISLASWAIPAHEGHHDYGLDWEVEHHMRYGFHGML